MIKDSEARKHYLEIRSERTETKPPLGFDVTRTVLGDFYRQPYGLPNSHFETAES